MQGRGRLRAGSLAVIRLVLLENQVLSLISRLPAVPARTPNAELSTPFPSPPSQPAQIDPSQEIPLGKEEEDDGGEDVDDRGGHDLFEVGAEAVLEHP